jgi:hypothetical protein
VDDSAFHTSGDGDHLAGDVAREEWSAEVDDLGGHVFWGGDLREGHRADDPCDGGFVEDVSRHRGDRPAGSDPVHAHVRVAADDLVLQREQEAAEDPGFRGRVVGVAVLAEAAGRRADEDERALAVVEVAQEATGGEEGRRQVRVDGRAPPLERQLPDRHVPRRPYAGDRRAHVELTHLGEHPVDVGLVGEVGLDDRRGARGVCTLATPVVVAGHVGTLRGEQADAGGADPAGAAGDEHACLLETCLHGWKKSLPICGNVM